MFVFIIPQISFLYNQQNATSAYGQLHIHHHFCKTDTGNDDLSSDGYIHRNGLKDQKAFDYAIEVAQLNSDFRPTKDMIEAINWLVEHNINYVGQMFFETVNALQAGKDLMAVMNKNLRNDLKKDSFTKEEIGGMLGYMREITKMGKDLPKLIAELKEAEDNYVKSKLKKTIVRGGKELAASMDVHNNIDNGVGGGIDMID